MAGRIIHILKLLGLLILSSPLAFAADKQPLTNGGISTRVAFVIGNANYPESPLPFTINDANDMAQALSDLGFDVTVATNANLKQMEELSTQFIQKAQTANVALFYFAGHGESHFQGAVGENFLLPVKVRPGQGEGNLQNSIGVSANILNKLGTSVENRITILILDACRTKAVTRNLAADMKVPSLYQGGLVKMYLPSGTFVAYGTAPGTDAFESPKSEHGRFTEGLLKHIHTPDLPIEHLFKRVRSDVERASAFTQSPREESSLRGDQDFYFVDPARVKASWRGSITRYATELESSTTSPTSNMNLVALDSIRTTPRPSRIRALRELIETRAPALSLTDAERVLSYFWRSARLKALRTMAPQLPTAMSLPQLVQLMKLTGYEPRPGLSNPLGWSQYTPEQQRVVEQQYEQQHGSERGLQGSGQRTFEELKYFGKVGAGIESEHLERELRRYSSDYRCSQEKTGNVKQADTFLSSSRDEGVVGDTGKNQELLRLAEDHGIDLKTKRELLHNVLETHRVELSFSQVKRILQVFPGDMRSELLFRDLNKALPDYLTWKQVIELLPLIEGNGRLDSGYQVMPRVAVVGIFAQEGRLDNNLLQDERWEILKLFTDNIAGWMRQQMGLPTRTDSSTPNVPDKELTDNQKLFSSMYSGKEFECMAGKVVGGPMGGAILDEFLACGQDNSPLGYVNGCP